MNDQAISILGCGWLGLPLAQRFKLQGLTTRGSSTSQSTLKLLTEQGIDAYQIEISAKGANEIPAAFLSSQVLVITIPFKRSFTDPQEYFDQIASIAQQAENSPIEFVVFTSSTSIYDEAIARASEDEQELSQAPRAQALHAIEQMLLGNSHFKATIVRLGGLYGGERKLGRFIAGKTNLKDGKKPVNLIHLDDCVAIISKIIDDNIQGEIFNAVSDEHPMREEIYTKAAKHLGLEAPQFLDEDLKSYKIVDNTKLKRILNYSFIHPNPLEL